MKWRVYVVALLIIVSGVFYYNLAGDVIGERQKVFVLRVIDGDTIELESGLKARLKGINTPEKSMMYWNEARDFLVNKIEGRNIEIVSFGGDKYGRLLVYVFINKENVNEEILENGLGGLYYYDKDDYYDDLSKAEEFARLNQQGIWEKSEDADCVKLIKLEHDEPEELVLENICDFNIEVLIKDDATHIYHEVLSAKEIFILETSHIWNTNGDSVYVWDEKGLLIFYRY
tara:strand:- start:4382 stop:5071 length:690 start_codon:yes stop_codon:yes gene_type:complete